MKKNKLCIYPFILSLLLSIFLLNTIVLINTPSKFLIVLYYINFIFLVITTLFWCHDNFSSSFNIIEIKNYILFFNLFLFSEGIIFIALFISVFYSTSSPNVLIGNVNPPIGQNINKWWSIALSNTVVLFLSSITITIAEVNKKNNKKYNLYIYLTLFLGLYFFICQIIEFKFSHISITSGVVSSLFFCITSLHFIHVFIGLIFIFISFKN